jgi:hypothetical protein
MVGSESASSSSHQPHTAARRRSASAYLRHCVRARARSACAYVCACVHACAYACAHAPASALGLGEARRAQRRQRRRAAQLTRADAPSSAGAGPTHAYARAVPRAAFTRDVPSVPWWLRAVSRIRRGAARRGAARRPSHRCPRNGLMPDSPQDRRRQPQRNAHADGEVRHPRPAPHICTRARACRTWHRRFAAAAMALPAAVSIFASGRCFAVLRCALRHLCAHGTAAAQSTSMPTSQACEERAPSMHAPPRPHLRRDWARSYHICAGTGLASFHICVGTGLAHTTSAPGPGSPRCKCGTEGGPSPAAETERAAAGG